MSQVATTMGSTLDDNCHESVDEWLSFKLDNVLYAVDILRVIEIRTREDMTRVPFAHPCVKGLINIRGAIVPIIDLKTRFNQGEVAISRETVVLIATVRFHDTTKSIGFIVDQISEVLHINRQDFGSSAEFDLTIDKRFVKGISDVNSKMAILLDIDSVLDIGNF